MGDLTRNLSRHEFTCKCGCTFDTVDFSLISILQTTVNHFSQKYGDCRIDILGGNRCKDHNDHLRQLYESTNGKQGFLTARNSQHIHGRAADFKVVVRNTNKPVPPREIFDWLDDHYGESVALGLYINRVHVDSRTHAGQRWGI